MGLAGYMMAAEFAFAGKQAETGQAQVWGLRGLRDLLACLLLLSPSLSLDHIALHLPTANLATALLQAAWLTGRPVAGISPDGCGTGSSTQGRRGCPTAQAWPHVACCCATSSSSSRAPTRLCHSTSASPGIASCCASGPGPKRPHRRPCTGPDGVYPA